MGLHGRPADGAACRHHAHRRHAVSTTSSVLGPYEEHDSVLPPFTHEPDVVRAPTGEIVMISVHGCVLLSVHGCFCCLSFREYLFAFAGGGAPSLLPLSYFLFVHFAPVPWCLNVRSLGPHVQVAR